MLCPVRKSVKYGRDSISLADVLKAKYVRGIWV